MAVTFSLLPILPNFPLFIFSSLPSLPLVEKTFPLSQAVSLPTLLWIFSTGLVLVSVIKKCTSVSLCNIQYYDVGLFCLVCDEFQIVQLSLDRKWGGFCEGLSGCFYIKV
ncbi:hypothetical protein RJT34_27879 [Clitoria ternatea]|uniref:Uncharacterized protein n=1 Tax=Clitoria ternatea TaxID=43366 RepID=A0AAN9F849_CLITE